MHVLATSPGLRPPPADVPMLSPLVSSRMRVAALS